MVRVGPSFASLPSCVLCSVRAPPGGGAVMRRPDVPDDPMRPHIRRRRSRWRRVRYRAPLPGWREGRAAVGCDAARRRMRCVVARRRPIAVTQQAPAVAPADVADHLRRLPAGRDATERRRRTRRGAHRRARAVDVGGRTLCIRDRPVARIDSPDLARRLVAGRRRRDADESAHRRARDDVTMTALCRRPDAPRRRPQAGNAAAPGRAWGRGAT